MNDVPSDPKDHRDRGPVSTNASGPPMSSAHQPGACHGPQTGPHNRCHHPTALPPGYAPCTGDPGCAIRIPTRLIAHGAPQLCCWHHDAYWDNPTHDHQVEQLMGAKPEPNTGKVPA